MKAFTLSVKKDRNGRIIEVFLPFKYRHKNTHLTPKKKKRK